MTRIQRSMGYSRNIKAKYEAMEQSSIQRKAKQSKYGYGRVTARYDYRFGYGTCRVKKNKNNTTGSSDENKTMQGARK